MGSGLQATFLSGSTFLSLLTHQLVPNMHASPCPRRVCAHVIPQNLEDRSPLGGSTAGRSTTTLPEDHEEDDYEALKADEDKPCPCPCPSPPPPPSPSPKRTPRPSRPRSLRTEKEMDKEKDLVLKEGPSPSPLPARPSLGLIQDGQVRIMSKHLQHSCDREAGDRKNVST